jgi:hypothetical protein
MSYEALIAWRRLTHGGRRGRDQMSPEQRLEYDAWNFTERSIWDEPSGLDHEAVKRQYEEATRGSK